MITKMKLVLLLHVVFSIFTIAYSEQANPAIYKVECSKAIEKDVFATLEKRLEKMDIRQPQLKVADFSYPNDTSRLSWVDSDHIIKNRNSGSLCASVFYINLHIVNFDSSTDYQSITLNDGPLLLVQPFTNSVRFSRGDIKSLDISDSSDDKMELNVYLSKQGKEKMRLLNEAIRKEIDKNGLARLYIDVCGVILKAPCTMSDFDKAFTVSPVESWRAKMVEAIYLYPYSFEKSEDKEAE